MAYAKVHTDEFYDILPAGDDGYWLGSDSLVWAGLKVGAIDLSHYSGDIVAPITSFYKSRGTKDSPAIVELNDALGVFNFWGWDGVAWARGAAIQVSVNGTPGADDMPGRIEFWTSPDGSDALVEALRIFTDGTKATIIPATGDYLRIGDATVSASGLNSNDDLLITGNGELGGNLSFVSGKSIKVGTTAIMDLATTYINVLKFLHVRANLDFPIGGTLTLGADLASGGYALKNANHLELDEITTPSAVSNHGKVYTKADNLLYFQSGDGVEHEIAYV